MRANPHPTRPSPDKANLSNCFNPRVRANPHPTQPENFAHAARSVSILECERTRTRPVGLLLSKSDAWFQSSSASEPAPDVCPVRGDLAYPIVSILECERTRTRPPTLLTSTLISGFQSSSASEPAPDEKCGSNSRSAKLLFQSSSASEPAPDDPNFLYDFIKWFQSSSASEPAPDSYKNLWLATAI